MPWRVLRACIAERGNVLGFKRFDRKVSESDLQYFRILAVILGRALQSPILSPRNTRGNYRVAQTSSYSTA